MQITTEKNDPTYHVDDVIKELAALHEVREHDRLVLQEEHVVQ